jgi:hypothetical protein
MFSKARLRLAKSAIGIAGMMIATNFGWGAIVAIAIPLSRGKMFLDKNGIMTFRRIILYRVFIEPSTASNVMGKTGSFEMRSAVSAVIRTNLIPPKIQTMQQQDFHASVSCVI